MVVKIYENARAYLIEHEAALLEHEALSQLVLYNAYRNPDTEACDSCLFGIITDEDIPILHFSNVAPKNMAVYAGDHPKETIIRASAALADFMADNHITFSGLFARLDVCQAFTEQYKNLTNTAFLAKLGMDIMEIRQVNDIKPKEGKHRLAMPDEVKMITDWMIRFQIEALASEIDYETALEHTSRLLENNKIYIYEDMGQAVSMAAATRQLIHGVAINYVYTPEEFRGKGYAATNLYYMSKEFLEQGNEFCTLFVDKRNPLSSRAYEKVGFRMLDEIYEYKLIVLCNP